MTENHIFGDNDTNLINLMRPKKATFNIIKDITDCAQEIETIEIVFIASLSILIFCIILFFYIRLSVFYHLSIFLNICYLLLVLLFYLYLNV